MGGNRRRAFPHCDDRARPDHRRLVVRHFEYGNFWSVAACDYLAYGTAAPENFTLDVHSFKRPLGRCQI